MDNPAAPTVMVGGVDVSSCDRVIVVLERGSYPRVILESAIAPCIEGLANAVYQGNGMPTIREWLNHIDPQQLEENALSRLGMEGATQSTGRAFLLALSEIAP